MLPRFLLAWALALSLGLGQDSLPWPFGRDPRAGGRAAFAQHDLYNLGPLGAKARDASRSLVSDSGSDSVQRTSSGESPHDRGPDRLLVEMLFPDGPAAKAGLLRGDIVIGVRGRPFDEAGSLGPLASAITAAEVGAKNQVRLLVERPSQAKPKGPIEITVTIPKGGKALDDPTSVTARTEIAKSAAKFLADHQEGDGGFAHTLAGTTGVVCQTSLAGLAWLATGNTRGKGPEGANLEKAVSFVLRHGLEGDDGPSGTRENWNQTTWAVVHGTIFLAEVHGRSRSDGLRGELQKFVDEIQRRQEASGGFGHGPGGPNALGYVELNILGSLALSALGMAERAGCTIDTKKAAKLLGYLEESASSDGGVGYSTGVGQRGEGNIGRTAAAWLGCLNLGFGRQPFPSKMGAYVAKNAGDVLGGHASLMQHVLLAGLGAQAAGPEASRRYWASVERDLVLARAPDGSLQPRPWHESVLMGSNSDVSFGEIWTTSAWAIVLAAEPPKGGKDGGLPRWLGRDVKARQ